MKSSHRTRANRAKSKCPKSAATSEISSRNALKHGFTSYESPDQFRELLADFKDALLLANGPEEDVVNQKVPARWRTMRIWSIETRLYGDQMDRQRARREEQSDPVSPNNPFAGAFQRTLRQLRNHRALRSPIKHSGTPRVTCGTDRFLERAPAKSALRSA